MCGMEQIEPVTEERFNAIKLNMLKRIMQLPYATPSVIVQYEFGIIDLDLEVMMEKVLLYFEILRIEPSTIERKLLEKMLSHKVPGFCRELEEALHTLGMGGDVDVYVKMSKEKSRKLCKEKLVQLQEHRILEKMVEVSKSDNLLFLNEFKFDGKMKDYLYQLPFEEARVVFMLRSRMFPSKANYKGRWKTEECEFCALTENDKHLFSCPAYIDLTGNLNYHSIVSLQLKMDELYEAAVVMNKVKGRIEMFNK